MEIMEVGGREEEEEEEGSRKIMGWRKQISLRGVVASMVIGSIYSVIAMKLNLTTGLVPNLNISAALMGFVLMRSWTRILHRLGIVSSPFTPQENTMIQTCSVACYTIAVGGGFGSYLAALSKKMYLISGGDGIEGNSPNSYKDPAFGWMTAYLFLACFAGLFVLIPLRKLLIIDYNLVFPSGTATSVLINGFHSRGDEIATKQVKGFIKYFSFSFLWGFFQWFYSGKEKCGFSQFPSFGLQARKHTFYFDFSLTFVGTGMICPHIVNVSLLLGAVLSWGILWPIISRFEGKWYPRNLEESSMEGLNGYKTFLSIALILGDGLYNFIKITIIVAINIHRRIRNNSNESRRSIEEEKDEIFERETIPTWVAMSGYTVFSTLSTILIPAIFPQLKWYYLVPAYTLAPALAFCNAYGAGLSDMNMSYNYGKVALFVLAALSGHDSGVVAGLAGCGLVKSVVSTACILMQDLKTAHLTRSSPRAMFLAQATGTALGCLLAPLTFLLFFNAFDVGNPKGDFKAPYVIIYRNMAILGVRGFSALPRHCMEMCCGFFVAAVAGDMVRDLCGRRVGKWVPLPMVMALPFLVGAYFSIDMCLGSLIVVVWERAKRTKKNCGFMIPAVASGFICGEGLWILPSSLLALARVRPPICMNFFAS